MRRFFELLLTSIILSVTVTWLNTAGILSTKQDLFSGTFIGTAIFVFINIRMLRHCYFDLRSNPRYYLLNLAAYLLFTALGFVIYNFCPDEIYTWIFAITKFVKYINNLPTFYSALTFHCIGILTIFLAPLGMRWIFMYYQ